MWCKPWKPSTPSRSRPHSSRNSIFCYLLIPPVESQTCIAKTRLEPRLVCLERGGQNQGSHFRLGRDWTQSHLMSLIGKNESFFSHLLYTGRGMHARRCIAYRRRHSDIAQLCYDGQKCKNHWRRINQSASGGTKGVDDLHADAVTMYDAITQAASATATSSTSP